MDAEFVRSQNTSYNHKAEKSSKFECSSWCFKTRERNDAPHEAHRVAPRVHPERISSKSIRRGGRAAVDGNGYDGIRGAGAGPVLARDNVQRCVSHV